MKAGIVGAGILGRLLALRLVQAGWKVTLWDSEPWGSPSSCSFVAAGMLSPLSEIETAEVKVFEMGLRSMELWASLVAELGDVYYKTLGSLLIAHAQDADELVRIQQRFDYKLNAGHLVQRASPARLAELEPGLAHWPREALFLPHEGHLDNRQVMQALAKHLETLGAEWNVGVRVDSLEPGKIHAAGQTLPYDQVFDCRGLGAQTDWPQLRGVRGELIHVQAHEVNFSRPVRLIHPRFRIYIVPRPDHVFVLGASQIESQDLSPISVRTTLELLSAAYSVHPGFAEARILGSYVHCRPAFPDNLPRIAAKEGLVRINGLYRHGYLLAPTVVENVLDWLSGSPVRDPELLNSEGLK
ncbi:MAG: glycine oxidase ThiO [Spirochaetales bacterium]|nr:glycine oxidase ThiO [Spirochaetales bacterium]